MRKHPPPEVRFWSRVNFLTTDGCWVWIGAGAKGGQGGYGQFTLNRKTVVAHRLSYKWLVGPIDGVMLDHKCRNTLCVRPDHLRPATPKQNGENRGLDRNNKSGVRGVRWKKYQQCWGATVVHNGVLIKVGLFKDIRDAEAVVVAKRLELYTHNELDKMQAHLLTESNAA